MVTVSSLGHVALRVRDADAVARFYIDHLGLSEMFRMDDADGNLWLVCIRLAGDQFLELYPAHDKAMPDYDTSYGWNHVCLTVDDIEAAVAEVEAAGIPLTSDITTGRTGNRQAWIADPEGNRIELMQMAPDGRQMRALAEAPT